MKKIMIAAGLFIFSGKTFAQKDDAAKYAAVINTTILQKHLTVIAGDEMQGRETGTAGQRLAASYIEAQFKQIGLATAKGLDGYQQFYPVLKDTISIAKINIGHYPSIPEVDFLIPRANNSGNVKANELIFAGYGIEDKNYNDYEGIDVQGKMVIIVLGEPKKRGIT